MLITNKIAPSAENPNVSLLAPIRTSRATKRGTGHGFESQFDSGARFPLAGLAVAISTAGEAGSALAQRLTSAH
jgi:hypothetical protein